MNKTLLTVLVLTLIIGLGGMFYLKLTYEPPTSSELAATEQTLQDLLLTPNQSCDFQVNDKTTGILYAAESNFRVDFTDNDENTHMISDLTNVFVWFDGKEIGIRVPWPIDLVNSDLDAIATRILDLGISVESQCEPWVVDSSKFVLPDIDFKDFGPKQPGSIQENEDSDEKKAQCDACDELDQNASAKCKNDLECF
jgi:hypothetical protein